jgi:C4-dicarboxylate transporter
MTLDDERPTDSVGQRWEGTGMKITVERTGYAWFLDKIDWDTMFLQAAHPPYMQLHAPSVFLAAILNDIREFVVLNNSSSN